MSRGAFQKVVGPPNLCGQPDYLFKRPAKGWLPITIAPIFIDTSCSDSPFDAQSSPKLRYMHIMEKTADELNYVVAPFSLCRVDHIYLVEYVPQFLARTGAYMPQRKNKHKFGEFFQKGYETSDIDSLQAVAL